MSDTIRLATIGTSTIGDSLLDAAASVGRISYVGTLSRNADTARVFTERHGGTTPFTSLDELAASDSVDAVYIATPNACHLGQALACMRGGKHVLVEKSLCANAYEAEELFAAADLHGVVAMEAMRPVHDPGWATVVAALRRLGRLCRVSLRYGKYSSRYDELLAGRRTNIFDTRMATGGLLDMGIYSVETMTFLFGRPDRVVSAVVPLPVDGELTGGTLDGAGSGLATYLDEAGRPSHVVDFGWSKISRDDLASEIEGEAATIVFDPMGNPTSGRVTWRGTAVRNAGAGAAASVGDRVEELAFDVCENDMVYEVADFARLVAEACEVGAPPDELDRWQRASLDALYVTDEVRRQAGIVFPAEQPAPGVAYALSGRAPSHPDGPVFRQRSANTARRPQSVADAPQ